MASDFSPPAGSRCGASAHSGIMGAKVDAFDWSLTKAGAAQDWPDALKTIRRTVMLSRLPMLILIGDSGLMLFNDALCDEVGQDFSRWLGCPIGEVSGEQSEYYLSVLAPIMQGETKSLTDLPFDAAIDGHVARIWFDIDITPIFGQGSKVLGALAIFQNITARVQALRASHPGAPLTPVDTGEFLGFWEVDFRENRMQSNAQFALMHGVAPELADAGHSPEIFFDAVHPDDRNRLRKALAEARASGHFLERHRVISPQGERWLLSSARFRDIRGEDLFGVSVDITDHLGTAAALALSETRFQVYAETLPHIIFSWGADGTPYYANQRWLEFTGRRAGDPDLLEWQSFLHPSDRAAFVTTWSEAIRLGYNFDDSARFRTGSDGYRWMRGIMRPMRQASGLIEGWIGTLSDIHDARLAEAERELVSQELNHRLKNFFTVVQGLVNLSQRDNTTVAGFADSLRGRLGSLYTAHSLLQEAGAQQDSLHTLIRQTLAPYLPTDGPHKLLINGEDLELSPRTNTAFALIFHELATNAVKYGGLSTPEGRIRVTMNTGGAQFNILWIEDGLPDQPNTSAGATGGFGSRLLRMLIEGQLQGSFYQDRRGNQIVTALEIPLAP